MLISEDLRPDSMSQSARSSSARLSKDWSQRTIPRRPSSSLSLPEGFSYIQTSWRLEHLPQNGRASSHLTRSLLHVEHPLRDLVCGFRGCLAGVPVADSCGWARRLGAESKRNLPNIFWPTVRITPDGSWGFLELYWHWHKSGCGCWE